MHRTNITTNVVESTHIVCRVMSLSLTFPCGSSLRLIFFSSGRCFSCCPLGEWTACWETVGLSPGLQFLRPSRLNWTAKRAILSASLRAALSWEWDWVTECRRFGPLLLHPTCSSGWVFCTVLAFSPCSQFSTCTLRRAATLWRRLTWMKSFIHNHTKEKTPEGKQ